MKEIIQKLLEVISPSGYEDAVRDIIRDEIKNFADEVRVDALGNLIARIGQNTANGKRVMVSAHMDEIGIMVTHVDEKGFVRFTNLGGVFPLYCLGGRVRFTSGVPGVISQEPGESRDRVWPLEKMYIDVGATSREDCPVKVGDVAGFERPLTQMGNRLVSKAMDDRIGVVVMIEALRQLKKTPHEVYFVFSVQEEVGLRGATTSAYGVDPEIGISIDVTDTGDKPKDRKMEVSLGKGPAVKVRDGGMLSDPRIVRWMANMAEKNKIPFQYEVLLGGTTDAKAIQLTRAGVPSGCISIPCRYIHSPSEMVDQNDVENAVRLLTVLLTEKIDLL